MSNTQHLFILQNRKKEGCTVSPCETVDQHVVVCCVPQNEAQQVIHSRNKQKKKKRYLQTIKSAQYTEICEAEILTERIQLKKKSTQHYEE